MYGSRRRSSTFTAGESK
jgi:hypothetical protein